MKHFAAALWPIHYKPLPDELLSSWLVRLAHGHGMKAQTFCNIVFGNRQQVWNRDIDRLAPEWLLNELVLRTGTTASVALNTTLRFYEGKLYKKFRTAGILNWILVLQMYHRKRIGFGLQFCPACLAGDEIPYFRKSWRIAFYTVCTRHNTMLLDRCPKCGTAVAAHRIDMQVRETPLTDLLWRCHSCDGDLRQAPKIDPVVYDNTSVILKKATEWLSTNWREGERGLLTELSVLRQLCRIMTARYEHAKLRPFVLEQLGRRDIYIGSGHISLEMRPVDQRHHLVQLAAWLLEDLEPRLTSAWRAGAIRYNLLLKDFPNPPPTYVQIVSKFSNWRIR